MTAAAFHVRLARPSDLDALGEIERAAATLLAGQAPPAVLAESTPLAELQAVHAAGRLWVAIAGERPVGFALVELLAPGQPHLEEMDVHPAHGRRGIGTALVRAVQDWLAASPYDRLTLTTFRAVPWNMPFYARLGFVELPRARWSPEVTAVVADETARGLDPARRVVMAYRRA